MMTAKPMFQQYNSATVLDTVSKLNIFKTNDNHIITEFGGREISNSQRSGIYGVFNFSEFINRVLGPVEQLFRPTEMKMMISGGHQELRLLGGERTVNNQTYNYMLSIFSSSDGTRALTLAAGLMRLVCTNGMVVGAPGEHANIKTKHYEKSMPEKVEWFLSNLEKIPQTLEQQVQLISSLDNKIVSLKQVANNLCFTLDNEGKQKELVSMKQTFKNLMTSLWYSQTDRIDKNVLSREQKSLFWSPEKLISGKTSLDIMVPASQVFNCFTENVRNQDMAKIQSSSTKIYNALRDAIDFETEMQEF